MVGKLLRRWMGPGLAVAVSGAASPLPLLPPIREPLRVTSSFGEYREGHYHGGLDLSTGGREGVPVQAPRDGFVFRLRASGVGYGRAVYFRLDDGRTVLYGHLSRFTPRIQAVVDSVQDREERYEVDFHPKPGALAFRAGDILGYSGQSGAGPPHLHAEMRAGDDASVAVNPLGQGWTVPDTVAPRITRLRLEPAAPGALVNGGVNPVILAAASGEATARVSGPFRLWVECSDRAQTGNRLAPRVVRATLDTSLEAEVLLDRFHWSWAREVEWTFDNARARRANERWVTLEPPPGSRLRIARGDPRWAHSLSPGTHRIRIEAEDGSGNQTAVRLRCTVVAPGTEAFRSPRIERTTLASRGPFLEVRVAGGDAARAIAESREGERADWTRLASPEGTVFQLGVPPAPGPWRIRLHGERGDSVLGEAVYLPGNVPDDPGSVPAPRRVEAGGCTLRIRPGATYGPLWILIRRDEASPPPDGELRPVGGTVRLEPWAWPLRERIGIELPVPPGVPRRGTSVCRRTKHGWSFEDADTSGAGVGADIADLETLCLFRDATPPAVRIRTPHDSRTLVARIRDRGVGITWRDVRMTLDGRTVITEWDPEADRLTGTLRRAPARGEHTIMVEAADRAGNRTVERLVFTAGP